MIAIPDPAMMQSRDPEVLKDEPARDSAPGPGGLLDVEGLGAAEPAAGAAGPASFALSS